MMRASLYDFPELYATLLAPEKDLLEDIDLWVQEYLEGSVLRVMDPACGPGGYLLPYYQEGLRVAGNDIHPAMVAWARRALPGPRAELTRRDMAALRFRTGPFDLALNLSSSVGHLATDRAVGRHLQAVARHLRPGGIYLLGLPVLEREELDDELWVLWESEPLRIPSGGMAVLRYESVSREGRRRRERIRLVLLANGVAGCPPVLEEEYWLRTFPVAVVRRLVAQARDFELLAAHDMTDPHRAARELGAALDVTLVLRRT